VGCPSLDPGTNLNARTRIFGSIWYPFFSKISRNTQRVADPAPVRGSATRGTRMNNGQLSLSLWRLSLRRPILSLVVSCFLALQFHVGLCTASLSLLARSPISPPWSSSHAVLKDFKLSSPARLISGAIDTHRALLPARILCAMFRFQPALWSALPTN